jgi:hypothetical protein
MAIAGAAAAIKAFWAAYGAYISLAAMSFSVVSSVMSARKAAKMTQQESASIKLNTCDSVRRLPVVYGEAIVGINRVYTNFSGSDNKYLHLIGTLCEGEIEGIKQVAGVDQLFINDRLYTDYGNRVYYEFFNGSPTQNVCATLHTAIPEWSDPLRNTAYIYVRLKFDMDYFQALPDITVHLEGLKVYNADTTVTEYSRNGAWVARDFLTRSSVRGGMGFGEARLNDASFIDTAAYCTAKGWNVDFALTGDYSADDYLSHILAAFRGALIYSMTDFQLRYRDMNYESAVMAIDEEDVVSGSMTITQPDVFDTPNAIKITYFNKEKGFQDDTLEFSDQSLIAADGGDYRVKTMDIPSICEEQNAQRMAWYWLERLRQNKEADFAGSQRLFLLDPMDLITLSSTRFGWTGKYFRVTKTVYDPDGDVHISAEEEDIRFYDDVYNLAARTWNDTNLITPLTAVPSVRNVSLTEEQYDYRDRTFTRLKLDFEGPTAEEYPFWRDAEIWMRVGESGDYRYMTRATTDYLVDPVQEGEVYSFTLVSVSIFETRQADEDAFTISTTVVGRTTLPGNINSFSIVVAGDTMTIQADPLNESDIAYYELRMGPTWRGGLYLGANETPNFRFVGVRPGTHTLWMAARGNNGYYSETPVSATATVYYPPGYVLIPVVGEWSWDYDAIGTFDNTEHTTHSAVDALMCSHSGSEIDWLEMEDGTPIETEDGYQIQGEQDVGGLTGTWLSPEYDLGSIMTVRVWGDFLFDFLNSAATWDSIFPSPATTWFDVMTPTTTWDELFANAGYGVIRATVYWGDTSGNLTSSVSGFELLAAEFSARYVQVRIAITDPNYESNMYLYTLNMKAAYWS